MANNKSNLVCLCSDYETFLIGKLLQAEKFEVEQNGLTVSFPYQKLQNHITQRLSLILRKRKDLPLRVF